MPPDTIDPRIWAAGFEATFLRKLQGHSPLDAGEREVLRGLVGRLERIGPRAVVVEDGAAPAAAAVLIEGFACRFKLLPDGRRQILSFHLAGDGIDLQSLLLGTADHGIAAVTDCLIAWLPHNALRAAARAHERIADALWRETLTDAAIARQWLLNVGQRDAYSRLAHLFCELGVRAGAAGLGRSTGFEMPATQVDLGDATGLTPVHINRTLQRLRGDRLIAQRGTALTILDWPRLAGAAGFDPAYLRLRAA